MGERTDFKFGGGGETIVHPVILLLVVSASLLVLALPRKYAVCVLLSVAFLIPLDQVVIVGSFHFMMLRVILLVGWARILMLKTSGMRLLGGGTTTLDRAVLWYAGTSVVGFSLLWLNGGAIINQMGFLYTHLGTYFLARAFIRDKEDVSLTCQALAYIAVVIAVLMIVEQATGRNPYAMFGTADTLRISIQQRNDRFRAMGPFLHPILAGTFGGTTLALFVGLYLQGGGKRLTGMIGILASIGIALCSNSSTPLLAFVAGIVALCFWPMRKRMRQFRRFLAIGLVGLHLAMKSPVWSLIQRADVVGGSSGFHRYQLVDQFIRHFSDWFLLGTKSNADWGWDMWDTANQYVAVGQNAGLMPLIFFIVIIVYGFKSLGCALQDSECTKKEQLLIWSLSAALLSTVVAFFGCSYFDQTIVAWYTLIAMIAAITASHLRPLSSVPRASSQSFEEKSTEPLSVPADSIA